MKKWIITLVCAAIGIIVFSRFYINVNAKYENITINRVVDQAKNAKFSFKILDKNFLDKEEIIEKYDTSMWADGYGDDYKAVVIDVEITNITGEEQLLETYSYELSTLGWSNGLCSPLFQQMNEEDSVLTLSPGESVTLSLPFFLLQMHFSDYYWNNPEEIEFEYIISKYPVRTEIII